MSKTLKQLKELVIESDNSAYMKAEKKKSKEIPWFHVDEDTDDIIPAKSGKPYYTNHHAAVRAMNKKIDDMDKAGHPSPSAGIQRADHYINNKMIEKLSGGYRHPYPIGYELKGILHSYASNPKRHGLNLPTDLTPEEQKGMTEEDHEAYQKGRIAGFYKTTPIDYHLDKFYGRHVNPNNEE